MLKGRTGFPPLALHRSRTRRPIVSLAKAQILSVASSGARHLGLIEPPARGDLDHSNQQFSIERTR